MDAQHRQYGFLKTTATFSKNNTLYNGQQPVYNDWRRDMYLSWLGSDLSQVQRQVKLTPHPDPRTLQQPIVSNQQQF